MAPSDGGGFLDNVGDDDEEDEEETQETEVVPVQDEGSTSAEDNALVQPVTSDLERIKETYEWFEQIKTELLDNPDIQTIGGNAFITKSGWRKIATAFGVSVHVVEVERAEQNGVVRFDATVKAVAPNGTTSEGVGSCGSNESNFMDTMDNRPNIDEDHEDALFVDGKHRVLKDPRAVNEHDIRSTAVTRAKNRAISDLVGGGEVSAEEMDPEQLIS